MLLIDHQMGTGVLIAQRANIPMTYVYFYAFCGLGFRTNATECNKADAHTQWTEMTRNLMTRSDPKGKKREGALFPICFSTVTEEAALRWHLCCRVRLSTMGSRWSSYGAWQTAANSPSAIFSCSNDKSYSATERLTKKNVRLPAFLKKASRSHKSWAQMLSA